MPRTLSFLRCDHADLDHARSEAIKNLELLVQAKLVSKDALDEVESAAAAVPPFQEFAVIEICRKFHFGRPAADMIIQSMSPRLKDYSSLVDACLQEIINLSNEHRDNAIIFVNKACDCAEAYSNEARARAAAKAA